MYIDNRRGFKLSNLLKKQTSLKTAHTRLKTVIYSAGRDRTAPAQSVARVPLQSTSL